MLELQVSDSSNVNAYALVWLVVVALVLVVGRPRHAVAGILLTALFVPLGQQFVIFGLHFRFVRLLILIGVLRVLMNGEGRKVEIGRLDRWLVAWTVVSLVCGIMRGPKAEMFGSAYDVLGGYFLFRALMTDASDLVWQLKVLAGGCIVLALFMSVELLTTRNPFFVFGGVPEFTFVRDGRLRCQGPFRHPILAGTFAAATFPLLVGLWRSTDHNRILAAAGMVSCVFICYIAASSGAVLTLLAAMLGLAMWPLRFHMADMRRFAFAALVTLAVLMNAPIWFLIAKISKLSGGTGWHRSYIINQAFERINEWWLIGSSYTAHWAWNPHTILAVDPDNMDITNYYIRQGLNGGLLGLCLFVAVIVACFSIVGRWLRVVDEGSVPALIVWASGVSLAAHCAAFVSVSYFDQILVFWIWLIAAIASIRTELMHVEEDEEDDAEEEELSTSGSGSSRPASAH